MLPEELSRTVFNTMTIFSLNTAVNEFLPPKGDAGKCGLQEDLGNVHWNSPLYGFEKYPRNFSCFFTVVPVSNCPFLTFISPNVCFFLFHCNYALLQHLDASILYVLRIVRSKYDEVYRIASQTRSEFIHQVTTNSKIKNISL